MGKLERVDALRQKHVALESMIDDEEKKTTSGRCSDTRSQEAKAQDKRRAKRDEPLSAFIRNLS